MKAEQPCSTGSTGFAARGARACRNGPPVQNDTLVQQRRSIRDNPLALSERRARGGAVGRWGAEGAEGAERRFKLAFDTPFDELATLSLSGRRAREEPHSPRVALQAARQGWSAGQASPPWRARGRVEAKNSFARSAHCALRSPAVPCGPLRSSAPSAFLKAVVSVIGAQAH